MFKNPFSFSGRIRRTEYGLSYILYTLMTVILSGVFRYGDLLVVSLLFYIPLLWFLFAQGAKRCHDRGHSGFYQIIPFYVFWLLFAEGSRFSNDYGSNPKSMPDLDSFTESEYTL